MTRVFAGRYRQWSPSRLPVGLLCAGAVGLLAMGRPAPPVAAAEPSQGQPTVETLKQEEIEVARQLVARFPRNHKAIGLLGNVYSNHGNHSQAERLWQTALKLNPNDAHGYDALATVALLREQHEQAAALWRKAARLDPKLPAVYCHLGQALMAMGKTQEAIQALTIDVEQFPGNNPSHWLLGQLHVQLQQYEKAKGHYRAAIRISPDFSKAYYGLAAVCARLGEKDESRKCLEKFKQLKAQQGSTDRGRRGAYDDLQIMRKQVADTLTGAGAVYHANSFMRTAEQLWKRAAELDPKHVGCRTHLADLYQGLDRNREALAVCGQLTQIEPDSPLRWLNLGVLHARLGQFDAARNVLNQAHQLAPDDSHAYRLLAQMHLEPGGDLSQALKLARRAVELQPIAPNHFVLGAVCVKAGDRPAAQAALKKAIALDPDNPKYRQTYRLFQKRD